MPDARTHDLITVVTGVALAPLSYGYLSAVQWYEHSAALNLTLWLVGAHLISGILFSPDLDIDSAIHKRWGLFYWIWYPYMKIVPHRHFWSHSLIVAPFIRLIYFYGVVTGLLFGWVWLMAQIGLVVDNFPLLLYEWIRMWWAENPATVLLVLIGFCTGSAAHTIADWLVTNGRGVLRMFGIRVRGNYRGHR